MTHLAKRFPIGTWLEHNATGERALVVWIHDNQVELLERTGPGERWFKRSYDDLVEFYTPVQAPLFLRRQAE